MNAYPLIKPLLFRLDPEQAHTLVHSVGHAAQKLAFPLGVFRALYALEDAKLSQNICGITFKNPVGLAAGFDKNAEIVGFMSSFGFGFLEVGSVTNTPSDGNPKPRLFRLPEDRALINRMGLNNKGPQAVLENLSRLHPDIPIGINVAKTNSPTMLEGSATDDMVGCYRQVCTTGQYTVLNVSCPNTKDGKTFEDPAILRELLKRIAEVRAAERSTIPLFVKFSSDVSLDALKAGIEVAEEQGIDGFILVNTSTKRDSLSLTAEAIERIGKGGLSGRPLQGSSLEKISLAYGILKGRKPIIGLGGVDSAEFAYRLIRAGANLVQVYTALVYEGPSLCKRINEGLRTLLERDGFANIQQAVGSAEPRH